MGYDPNDPNLVDEPDLDVENPYEGLGPGRPDPVSRVLMPTAGRQSPDSNEAEYCCGTPGMLHNQLPIEAMLLSEGCVSSVAAATLCETDFSLNAVI